MALRGGVPRKLAAAAREAVLAELARLKLRVNGKLQAGKIEALPFFQQTNHLSGVVKLGAELEQLFPDVLQATMEGLAQAPLAPSRPQLLLSFPHKTPWSLHNLNWHLDLKRPQADLVPGVQAFVLIDEVRAQGGGTLALAGSHRLANAHREAEFLGAPETFLHERSLHGVPLQIVEMCGRAGDVYLMDLRLLHSPSVNARRDLRMMATSRYLRR